MYRDQILRHYDRALPDGDRRPVDGTADVYLGPGPQELIDSLQPGTRVVLLSPRGEVVSIYELQ